jgi:ATP-dependent Clp protease protease subunit
LALAYFVALDAAQWANGMPDLAGRKIAYLGYTGAIDSDGVSRIAAAINNAVNNSFDEVNLCFSSLGGYVSDGIYLYNHIRGLPLNVVIHNVGSVSSIAVAVFVAAHERYCSPYAMFMIHPTVMPSQEGMTSERLQSSLNAALADDTRTENILRERAAIPEEILVARRFKDVYITPKEAVIYGLVHGVKEFSLPRGNQISQV